MTAAPLLVRSAQVQGIDSSRPVLEVENLSVTYVAGRGRSGHGGNQTPVLRDVSMSIAAGEVVAVVGESGSGKTTLGHAVLGLLPEESLPALRGSIRICGTEVVGAPAPIRRALLTSDIGAVFQDPLTSLNPSMRVGRQIQEVRFRDAGPEEWLRRVGIREPDRILRAFPHELSGGQRQRVMIAMAMAKNPRLVVADEPTTALDVTVQAQILRLIRSLCTEQGAAFLFVTHDLAVASALADRIVVLYAGRIVEAGRTRATAAAPAHPYTAALLSSRFNLDAPRGRQLPTMTSATGAGASSPREPACSFQPRCILATDICVTVVPPHVPAPRHDGVVACHHTQNVSAELWRHSSADWPASRAGIAGSLLEFSAVSKSFRQRGRSSSKVHVLRDISFSMREGEAVAIVGESGSGKSTLLKLVAGSIAPDSGRINYRSGDLPQIVFQAAAASLTPWLSVETQIEDRLRPFERNAEVRHRRISEALERVGLQSELRSAHPGQLSGGQAQRVAIARAIVVPPKLLLCDEAVSAMDVSLAAATMNLLGTLRRQLGMAILFVTHDLAAARFIADRIIVLKSGEIVDESESERLTTQAAHPYTRQLVADSPDQLNRASA